LKGVLRRSAQTIGEARQSLLLATAVFACGCLAGAVFHDRLGFLQDQVEKLLRQFSDKTALDFITSIFLHNLLAAYVAMCFITFFGILPLAIALFNGLLIGWFGASLVPVHGPEILFMLLPHGVFEIPAVVIAWGVGIWRGFGYRMTDRGSSSLERWQQAHLVFVAWVLPLLLMAAVIEGRYHLAKALLG